MKKNRATYYKVENMIFRSTQDDGFKRYDNGKWVNDFKWAEKIFFSDFNDFEYISEKEALKFIEENLC